MLILPIALSYFLVLIHDFAPSLVFLLSSLLHLLSILATFNQLLSNESHILRFPSSQPAMFIFDVTEISRPLCILPVAQDFPGVTFFHVQTSVPDSSSFCVSVCLSVSLLHSMIHSTFSSTFSSSVIFLIFPNFGKITVDYSVYITNKIMAIFSTWASDFT